MSYFLSRLIVPSAATAITCYKIAARNVRTVVPVRHSPPEWANTGNNRLTEGKRNDGLDFSSVDPFSTESDPELLETLKPELPISYNLAAFVNRSEVMQRLVQLGVDLSAVEQQNRSACEMLVHMNDFEKDVAPHIQILSDMGIPAKHLGRVITENPLIFKVPINNIKTRVEYLLSKRIPMTAVTKIIFQFPSFLNYSIKEVDARMGFIQDEFKFLPDQLRHILIHHPQLMQLETMTIRTIKFSIQDIMGFDEEQTKDLLVQLPGLLSEDHQKMVNIFDMLHNTALISHELMVMFPEVLMADQSQVKDRLDYLKIIHREQFDPKLPLYIPLTALASISDDVFATKYARTSQEDYDLFLKNR